MGCQSNLVRFKEFWDQVAIKMIVVQDVEKKWDARDQYALQATYIWEYVENRVTLPLNQSLIQAHIKNYSLN